ncbi:MAG: DUF4307 domain-containing protein [Actinomycetota bacterium]|nr:DUF4307 domain-containing protein [Actinomycetota bacterium]
MRRALALAALGALGVALLVLLASAAWRLSTPDVRAGLLGFEVVDDGRVEVVFEVVADARQGLACDLRAQDVEHTTVGAATVQVPAQGQDRRVVRATIPTRARAVNGEVQRCRRLQG